METFTPGTDEDDAAGAEDDEGDGTSVVASVITGADEDGAAGVSDVTGAVGDGVDDSGVVTAEEEGV